MSLYLLLISGSDPFAYLVHVPCMHLMSTVRSLFHCGTWQKLKTFFFFFFFSYQYSHIYEFCEFAHTRAQNTMYLRVWWQVARPPLYDPHFTYQRNIPNVARVPPIHRYEPRRTARRAASSHWLPVSSKNLAAVAAYPGGLEAPEAAAEAWCTGISWCPGFLYWFSPRPAHFCPQGFWYCHRET